jgi:hypothetical protein
VGRDRLVRRIQILIVFLPILLTFFYVHGLSVEGPMQDDWDLFVPHFQHLAAGQLQWSDINSQHNESLVAFPLAASLLLAKLTGGRLLAVTYLSYAFLCGALGVLFLFFRMLRLPGRWSVLWFLPASLLFLGWRQSDSLLWSTHLLNTMALFFILAALYCCTQVYRAPIFFLAAIVCAWVASFSMASGLFVWLFGVVALAIAAGGRVRFEQALRYFVGWLALGAVCTACFFFDVAPHPVPWPTGISFVLSNPDSAIRYALTYFGAPLGATPSQALYAGAVLVSITLPVLFLAWKNIRMNGVAPWLAIVGYVAVTLAPLLTARLGLGVEQAFAARYVTLGALAPIGVYFCGLGLARTVTACRYLAAAMFLLLSFGILNSYLSGLVEGRKESAKRTSCAAAVKDFRHVDRMRLTCGYPDPGVILERAPLLEQYHLSLFGR